MVSRAKWIPHLREEHFDREYIQATQAAFVGWGRKTVAQLNRGALRPEETPAYLLQYHTQHLLDAAAPAEAFLELVEEGWLRAWETFEGGYRGFSRDVRQAYEVLSRGHAADQPRFAQRLRCQLVRSSIHSIGANTPWKLLVAACKAGVLTYRQVAHWLEFQSSADRAEALGDLVPHPAAGAASRGAGRGAGGSPGHRGQRYPHACSYRAGAVPAAGALARRAAGSPGY